MSVKSNSSDTPDSILPRESHTYQVEINPDRIFQKLGLTVSRVGACLFVSSVAPGNLCYEAGIHVFDEILEVNGVSVLGFSVDKLHRVIHACRHNKNNAKEHFTSLNGGVVNSDYPSNTPHFDTPESDTSDYSSESDSDIKIKTCEKEIDSHSDSVITSAEKELENQKRKEKLREKQAAKELQRRKLSQNNENGNIVIKLSRQPLTNIYAVPFYDAKSRIGITTKKGVITRVSQRSTCRALDAGIMTGHKIVMIGKECVLDMSDSNIQKIFKKYTTEPFTMHTIGLTTYNLLTLGLTEQRLKDNTFTIETPYTRVSPQRLNPALCHMYE
eukprot:Awhi_evm1s3204